MKASLQLEINAPAEKVFEYLDDVQKLKEWMPEIVDTKYHGGSFNESDPVGTKFTQTIRERTKVLNYEGEVLAYKKNELLSIRLFPKSFTVDVTYSLNTHSKGTTLLYTVNLKCHHWFVRFMSFLFFRFGKIKLKKLLYKLKELAEKNSK